MLIFNHWPNDLTFFPDWFLRDKTLFKDFQFPTHHAISVSPLYSRVVNVHSHLPCSVVRFPSMHAVYPIYNQLLNGIKS